MEVLAIKKTIVVLILVAFLMVCVLAPYGTANAIVGISTAAVTILIAGLAAIGITFASTGGFDTLNDYVVSLLQDYASDNNIPVTSIFNGTQYSSSAAGKLLLNNRFVLLIDTFAQWIIGKFSLTNNNTITVVNSGSTLNGYTVYPLPFSIYRYSSPTTYEYTYYRTIGNEPVYSVPWKYDSKHVTIALFSRGTFTVTCDTYTNGTLSDTTSFNNLTSINGWYVKENTGALNVNAIVDIASYVLYTEYTLNNLLSGDYNVETNNIGVGIGTGTISLPTDNLDYTSGDGAILDVGASWGETTGGAISTVPDIWPEWLPQTETITASTDITIEYEAEAALEEALPQPSDIENLPGSTIPSLDELPSFQFQSLWHYVAQWISDMAAGGTVLWNVCIQAPSPIVNLVFAGIVLAMWFGAIKILR